MNEQESKKQILKSTGILGSVQVLIILVGMIRIKALAVLLGPVGVGIAGIYQTTLSIISSATNLGLNFSGVREIAVANSSGDTSRVSKTRLVLTRWSWLTGVFGMLITLILCKPLSRWSFGTESYTWGIAALSLAVMLSAVTGGMNAWLQGMRRIGDMAKANLLGSLIGLIGAVAIYFAWGINGIVPALLFTICTNLVVAWWFVRKIDSPKTIIGVAATYREGLFMARLGFFMVVTTVLNNGFMYLVRTYVSQQGGLQAAGHFVAAWTISSTYIAAIFGAMGADYYPRLSGMQHDHEGMKKLVNDQAEVALLITVPLLIGMVSFIEPIVTLFYSTDFEATASILKWQLCGDFIKILGYPLGFVLLAKAKGKLVIATELLWNFVYLGLVFFGWKIWGIQSTGIAFLLAYLVNVSIVFLIVKKTIGFAWSKNILRYFLIFLPLLAFAFLNTYFVTERWQQHVLGTALSLGAALFSFRHLKSIVDFTTLVQKAKAKIGLNRQHEGKLSGASIAPPAQAKSVVLSPAREENPAAPEENKHS